MISLRHPAINALLKIISVLIIMIGLADFVSCIPDSMRYRAEIARAERAAEKIEAYRQKNGRYPDDKDVEAFNSMGLQFDQDFYYTSSGKLNSTPERPFLIVNFDTLGCRGRNYDLANKSWVSWVTAC